MVKLFLFDIDGTLVTGFRTERFGRAIQNVHGIEIKSAKQFSGYTDQLILAALLEDEGWSDQQIKEAMPELLLEVDKVHKDTFKADDLKLLPGALDLLEKLDRSGNKLALITGNLESIARRKLEALGIWHYFLGGGYGSDPHVTRGDLVSTAIKRFGYQANIKDVYVIGDTPRDIAAAKEAGVTHSVGVSNGFRTVAELKSSGASIVLEDFKDTDYVLKIFGINNI